MIKKALMVFACILLLVSTPVSAGFLDIDDKNDERNLGEIVLVNVDRYEPTTISSDYIRNRNFPVYVYLSGTTLEGYFGGSSGGEGLETSFGDLKIKRFNIERQSISRYVSGVQEVPPPGGKYYFDENGKLNLGYLKLYLRKISVEEKIPDVIDINLTARIDFDTDSSFGVFGRQDLYFDGSNLENDVWSGKAKLKFISFRDNKANFELYDGSNNRVDSFSLRVNGNPHGTSLRDGPVFLDNKVRFALKSLGGTENVAVLGMGGDTLRVVEGMNLWTGSDWIVTKISDPLVILFNEDTKEEKILDKSSTGKKFRDFECEESMTLTHNGIKGLFTSDGEAVVSGDMEVDRDRVYCSAISEYESALTLAVGEERDELNLKLAELYKEVGDISKQLEYYSLINVGSEVYFDNNIGNEIETVKEEMNLENVRFEVFSGRRIFLEGFETAEGDSYFSAKVKGKVGDYRIGQSIKIDKYVNSDNREVNAEWKILDIKSGYVKVERVGFIGGKSIDEDPVTLNLNEVSTLIGEDDKAFLIEVTDIHTALSAVVSVLPGDGRNHGVSHFSLHIPIEKSLIQWTPEEIDSMIDKTHNTIGKINSALDKLGSFIKTMKVACFAVFSYVSVKNAFFMNNRARGKVVNDYSNNICPALVESGEYDSASECLRAKGSEIDSEVDKWSSAMDKADNLMKGYPTDSERLNQIASKLGEDADFVKFLESNEFRQNANFDADDLQKLLADGFYNETLFEENLESFDPIFSKVGEAVSSLEGVSDAGRRENILRNIFSDNREEVGGLSGSSDQLEYLRTTYNLSSATRVGQVDLVSGENFETWYNDEWVSLTPVIENGGSNQIIIDNKAVFKDSLGKLFYSEIREIGGDLSSDYFDYSVTKINHYDNRDRLWMFTFKKDGLFEGSGLANYVAVNYDENSQQRTYILSNVGRDGKIGGEDDIELQRISPAVAGSGVSEGSINYGKIYSAIDGEYVKRSKDRFVEDGTTVGAYRQSKTLVNSIIDPQSECISYMSSGDCKLLYNFCDPVMCPASRFNFGGKWPVDNVIGSGIIGSLVLGMPNWVAFDREGENIFPPVCLSGVHAGLDNVKTKFEGFEDCLQKAKANGESVGICNTIRSVYMCEIMWREGLSIFGSLGSVMDIVSEKVFGNLGGGGEYLNWKQSWSHLRDSMSFFTTTYATSAFASYKARDLGEFGSQICKAAIYGKAPGTGDFIGELLEPSSPYQFTGWFDEPPYSAVEQGKSVYRIYYHIYSGRDEDAYYYVYLKGPGKPDLMVTDPERNNPRGYLKRGEYADKSWTIDLDSGYTQMCINVNNKETCGFGKVSSAFSANYLNDLIVQDELNREIHSAEECMPDSPTLGPSLGSLTTPSNYGLVESGLLRVCSSYDPDGDGLRWSRVGDCGSEDYGCYVDKTTVELNDLQRRSSVNAQLDSANVDLAAQGAREANENEMVTLMGDYGKIVDDNIEMEDIKTLIFSDSGYYVNIIYYGDEQSTPVLIEAHKKLGNIYVALAGSINKASQQVRVDEIRDYISGVRGETEIVTSGSDVVVRLEIDSKGDLVYEWENEKWNKRSTNGFIDFFTRPPKLTKYVDESSYIEMGEFSSNYVEGLMKLFTEMQIEHDLLKFNVGMRYVTGIRLTCGNKGDKVIEPSDFLGMTYADFSSTLSEFCRAGAYGEGVVDISGLMNFVKINGVSNGVDQKSCNPKNLESYASWIKKYSKEYGVSSFLILAQIVQESGCNQAASSGAAVGLMQITEGTFNEICKDKISDVNQFTDVVLNPEKNIACGIKILKEKYDIDNGGRTADRIACEVPELVDKFMEYREWQAALRGYVGWGCQHPNYVEEVWTIYDNFINSLNLIDVSFCESIKVKEECLSYDLPCMWANNKCVDFEEGELDNVDANIGESCEFTSDLLECRNNDGCYVHDGFFKDSCISCHDLNVCEDIRDQLKCDGVCVELAGLDCQWVDVLKECVNS